MEYEAKDDEPLLVKKTKKLGNLDLNKDDTLSSSPNGVCCKVALESEAILSLFAFLTACKRRNPEEPYEEPYEDFQVSWMSLESKLYVVTINNTRCIMLQVHLKCSVEGIIPSCITWPNILTYPNALLCELPNKIAHSCCPFGGFTFSTDGTLGYFQLPFHFFPSVDFGLSHSRSEPLKTDMNIQQQSKKNDNKSLNDTCTIQETHKQQESDQEYEISVLKSSNFKIQPIDQNVFAESLKTTHWLKKKDLVNFCGTTDYTISRHRFDHCKDIVCNLIDYQNAETVDIYQNDIFIEGTGREVVPTVRLNEATTCEFTTVFTDMLKTLLSLVMMLDVSEFKYKLSQESLLFMEATKKDGTTVWMLCVQT